MYCRQKLGGDFAKFWPSQNIRTLDNTYSINTNKLACIFSISVRIENIFGLEKHFRTNKTPIQNIVGKILAKKIHWKKLAFFKCNITT